MVYSAGFALGPSSSVKNKKNKKKLHANEKKGVKKRKQESKSYIFLTMYTHFLFMVFKDSWICPNDRLIFNKICYSLTHLMTTTTKDFVFSNCFGYKLIRL